MEDIVDPSILEKLMISEQLFWGQISNFGAVMKRLRSAERERAVRKQQESS